MNNRYTKLMAHRIANEIEKLKSSPYSIDSTVDNEVKSCTINTDPHEALNAGSISSISNRDKVGDFYPWKETWRAPKQRRWDHYYPQEWDRYNPFDYHRKLTEQEEQEVKEAQEKILEQIKKWKQPKEKKEKNMEVERRISVNNMKIGTEQYSLRSSLGGVLWPAIHLSEKHLEIGIPGLKRENVNLLFRKINDGKGNELLEVVLKFNNNNATKDDILSKYIDFEKSGNPDALSMVFALKGFVSVQTATVEDGVLTLTLEQVKPVQNSYYSTISVE
jgi:hypothetical protein